MALALRSTLWPSTSVLRINGRSAPRAVQVQTPARLTFRAESSDDTDRQREDVLDLSLTSFPSSPSSAASSTSSEPSSFPVSPLSTALHHLAVFLAAGVLVLAPAVDAQAAQSGGRVGGQSFQRSRSAAPPPRARTQIRNNTNIYVAPPVTVAPIYGGGFFAPPPFFGGWGWSPFSVVTPGPAVAIGFGGGGFILNFFFFSIIMAFIANVLRTIFRRDDDDRY